MLSDSAAGLEDVPGSAGAPANEIEVTSEMIKAGFYAFAISPGSELLNEEDRPLIFANVYRAMAKARRL
jgi:hypothetical protein